MRSAINYNAETPTPVNNGSYGLRVMSVEFPSEVEFWEASGSTNVEGSASPYQLVFATPAIQGGYTSYDAISPNDGLYRFIKARHVRTNASESAFTTAQSVLPWSDYSYAAPNYPIRNGSAVTTQYAASSDDGDGQIISSTVGKTDGVVGNKQLIFGGEKGTCRHNQAIVFGSTYNSVPRVTIAGGNYITTQPGAKWGTLTTVNANQTGSGAASASLETFLSLTATNITTYGFTASCLLYAQSGSVTLTNRSHDFADPSLVAVGDTTAGVTISNAPAYSDTYAINTTGSFTYSTKGAGPIWGLTITLAVDKWNGSTWTEVGTFTHDYESVSGIGTDTLAASTNLNVSMTSSHQFRLRIKSVSTTGLFNSYSYVVKGYGMTGVPAGGITYQTAVGTTNKYYTSVTPYTDNYCEWKVEGTQS